MRQNCLQQEEDEEVFNKEGGQDYEAQKWARYYLLY